MSTVSLGPDKALVGRSRLISSAVMIALVTCALYFLAISFLGHPSNLTDYLSGAPAAIWPRVATITATPNSTETVHYSIINFLNEDIIILGGSAGCSCTALKDLPKTIRPHQKGSLSIDIDVSGKPLDFTEGALFFVRARGAITEIPVQIKGIVQPDEGRVPVISPP